MIMSQPLYDQPEFSRSSSDSSMKLHHMSTMHSPAMASSANGSVSAEIHKGQWTAEEDQILRELTSRLNARRTPCDDAECSNRCIEGLCAHAACTETICQHSRCTENSCLGRHSLREILPPPGSLVMVPLHRTLCAHSMNTEKRWTEIAAGVTKRGGRSRNAKQCRERWHQQVRPGLLHSPITEQEGQIILRLVQEMGTKWADISRVPELQRRSDNCIKNWYNSSQNKRGRHVTTPEQAARTSPGSPRGVHKVSSQRSSSRSDASQQRLYDYAIENGRQRPIDTSFTVLPPIRSPTHSHPESQLTPGRQAAVDVSMTNAPEHQSHDSYGYFHRRRESNASVNTRGSMRTNNSGPPTPSTARSLMFSQESGSPEHVHQLPSIDATASSHPADYRRPDKLSLQGLVHQEPTNHAIADLSRKRVMGIQALCNPIY